MKECESLLQGLGVWRMGGSQPGLRWSLSLLKTEKWLSWDFPQPLARVVMSILSVTAEKMHKLRKVLQAPSWKFRFLFLSSHALSLSVPVHRHCWGIGTVQPEKKRGLSDTRPGRRPSVLKRNLRLGLGNQE